METITTDLLVGDVQTRPGKMMPVPHFAKMVCAAAALE